MLDKGFWFFLQFPYNLSIVFLIFWFYSEANRKKVPLLILTIFILIASLWIKGLPGVFFWLPGGASTIIVITVFTLIFFDTDSKQNETVLNIPNDVSWNRDILKQELASVEKYDDRQRIYLDFVKKLNSFLSKIDKRMGNRVNYYFITSLALLFCINFGYWVFYYTTGDLSITQLFDKSRFESLVTDEKVRAALLEFYKKYGGSMLNYSASLTVILSTLSLFLVLPIIRWINSKKNKSSFFWLDLCFFKLPESTILIYIPILSLFVASIFYNILGKYSHWFGNLTFIFSVLYLLNGFAIVRAYTKARFLPFGFVFLIAFVSSWFVPQIFILLIFSIFIVGLLDFAFDIKKKALHHVSVRVE